MLLSKQKLLLIGLIACHFILNITTAQAAQANNTAGNLVTNGSFESSVGNSLVQIPDWEIMSSVYGNNAVTTPDINDINHNVGFTDTVVPFLADNVVASQDGETWLGIGISNTANGAFLQDEGVYQDITFANAGTYFIAWEEGNFGFEAVDMDTVGFGGSNKIQATLGNWDANQGNFIVNQTQTFSNSNFIDVSNTWHQRGFQFQVAQAGTQRLQFSLTSIATQNRAYFALDGVTITAVSAVPEPNTWAMLFAGLLLLGFQARKRNN